MKPFQATEFVQHVDPLTARPLLDLMLAFQGLEAPILDPSAAWRVFKEYLGVPSAVGATVGGFQCSVVAEEALGPGVLVRFIREVAGEDTEVGPRRRNVFLQLVYDSSEEGLEDRDLWMEPGSSLSEFLTAVEALPEFRFAMEAAPSGGEVFMEEAET